MSTPAFTPSQLAKTLTLPPGLDGTPFVLLDMYELQDSVAKSMDMGDPFWEGLCALYMPCLQRALLLVSKAARCQPTSKDRDGLDSFFTILAYGRSVSKATEILSWWRFLQENPGEVRQVFWSTLEALSRIPMDLASDSDLQDMLVRPLGVVLHKLLTGLFSVQSELQDSDLPSFSDTVKADISLRIPLLRYGPHEEHSTAFYDRSLDALERLPTMNWDVVGWIGTLVATDTWDYCTLLYTHLEQGALCRKGEMFVVDVCLVTIARKHQALDWKTHKKICFPAGW